MQINISPKSIIHIIIRHTLIEKKNERSKKPANKQTRNKYALQTEKLTPKMVTFNIGGKRFF